MGLTQMRYLGPDTDMTDQTTECTQDVPGCNHVRGECCGDGCCECEDDSVDCPHDPVDDCALCGSDIVPVAKATPIDHEPGAPCARCDSSGAVVCDDQDGPTHWATCPVCGGMSAPEDIPNNPAFIRCGFIRCGWCDERGHFSDDCPEPWVPSRRSVEAPGPKVQMPHNKTSEGLGEPGGSRSGTGPNQAGCSGVGIPRPSEEDSGPQTGAQAKPATSPELALDSHRKAADSGGTSDKPQMSDSATSDYTAGTFERKWEVWICGRCGELPDDCQHEERPTDTVGAVTVVPLADAEQMALGSEIAARAFKAEADQWHERALNAERACDQYRSRANYMEQQEDKAWNEAADAEKERDQWREECWSVYVESGEDPDGADARHLNPGEALRAVKDLRAEEESSHKDAVKWAEQYAEERAKREELVAAVRDFREANRWTPGGDPDDARAALDYLYAVLDKLTTQEETNDG